MRRFLLINSFNDSEYYCDTPEEFESVLFASLCGMAKIVRVLVEDKRALSVFEICGVSKEYTL